MKRRHDDPIFQDPRSAGQRAIDREVEFGDGPKSVPRRTSQPPEPFFHLDEDEDEEEDVQAAEETYNGGIEDPFPTKPPSF